MLYQVSQSGAPANAVLKGLACRAPQSDGMFTCRCIPKVAPWPRKTWDITQLSSVQDPCSEIG